MSQYAHKDIHIYKNAFYAFTFIYSAIHELKVNKHLCRRGRKLKDKKDEMYTLVKITKKKKFRFYFGFCCEIPTLVINRGCELSVQTGVL